MHNIQVKAWNWNDDKNIDMFCYSEQNKQPLIANFTLKKSTTIFRHKETYQIVKEDKISPSNIFQNDQIIILEKSKKGFYVVNGENKDKHRNKNKEQSKQQFLYRVCQTKTPIKKNDYIRIGKSTITIDQINLLQQQKKTTNFFDDNQVKQFQPSNRIYQDFYQDSTKASFIEDAPACRFCLSKSITNDNPLMIACNCQYVHKECLKTWVISKSQCVENKQSGIYYCIKKYTKCQICLQPLQIREIFPFFKTEDFQEYIQITKQVQDIQKAYFIPLKKQMKKIVTIGRKLENDVFIEDLSVSRFHCNLQWNPEEKQLFISDLESRFGTLIKLSCFQIQDQNTALILQRGRTKFQLKLKKNRISLIDKLRKSSIFSQ